MKNEYNKKLIVVSIILLPSAAWAYIDPASSSLIIQIIAASAVGILAFYKKIKEKVQLFLKKQKDKN